MVIDNIGSFYLISFLILIPVFIGKIDMKGSSFFEKNNTTAYKGVAIICIIFHHMIQRISNPGIFVFFKGIGYLGVSTFLLFSGYGISKSYLKNENYLNGFLKKRLSKIYGPFVLVNLINLLVNIFLKDEVYTINLFLKNLLGLKLMSSAMWYIMAIFYWYIIFYLIFRYLKKYNKIKMIFAVSLLWFFICHKVGVSKNWYDTTLIFPIGMMIGLYEEKFRKILIDNYINLVIFNLVIFCVAFILNFGKISIQAIVLRVIASATFSILVILLTMKINLANNKISLFIGSISFELFLIHDRLLGILNIGGNFKVENLMYYFVSIIVLSILLKKFYSIINSLNLRMVNNEKQLF